MRHALRWLLPMTALLLLGTCANLPSPLPDTAFAPGRATERIIASYYEDHASEDYGRCNRPYFDAITRADVIEDRPDRLVLDVRYRYWDRLRSEEDSHRANDEIQGSHKVCWGFESRRFTLDKHGGAIGVAEMTGAVRGADRTLGNVTLGGSLGAGIGGVARN